MSGELKREDQLIDQAKQKKEDLRILIHSSFIYFKMLVAFFNGHYLFITLNNAFSTI